MIRGRIRCQILIGKRVMKKIPSYANGVKDLSKQHPKIKERECGKKEQVPIFGVRGYSKLGNQLCLAWLLAH